MERDKIVRYSLIAAGIALILIVYLIAS